MARTTIAQVMKEPNKRVTRVRIDALKKNRPTLGMKTLKDIQAKNTDRPLTERQLAFVKYWAQGESPRVAARLAGYSSDSNIIHWRMMNDPAILKLYQAEKAAYAEAAQMSRKKVMGMLQEAYDMAKIKAEPAVMVAAAREVGKMCGFYEPEVKININVNGAKITEQLNNLSDEELMKLVEEGNDIIPGESTRLPDEETPLLEAPNESQ